MHFAPKVCWLLNVLSIAAPLLNDRAVAAEYQVATFSSDITIPIGHACMGGGKPDAKEILDPLLARGFVLLGDGEPVVVAALDWCQCNNESYDRWRQGLAEAAGTTAHRVMLATVHQHDAPICDLAAQRLLDRQGMPSANCDLRFHEQAIERTADEVKKSLAAPRRVTHFGLGQAEVDRIASNRRVVTLRGKITWERDSYSGDIYRAPEGQIDPWLKTLSLWNGDEPVLAWSTYAVHPMSHYGRGQVSADFPGLARARRDADDSAGFQIYFTGCAGDVTAGKYNDRSPELRKTLAERLYRAMTAAWENATRRPLTAVTFRLAQLELPPRDTGSFTVPAMQAQLADAKLSRWQRVSAALGLSWRERVARGEGIDVPCLDLADGAAQFMILPAEAFVAYQLAAQKMRPDSFVVVAGFGDGAPGYIPTEECLREGYDDEYCWVAPGAEPRMLAAMRVALAAPVQTEDVPTPLKPHSDMLRRSQPLEPEAALAKFRLPSGFRIELVAAEPLVRDPVAIAFDEAGRAHVVELPEYNQQARPERPAVRGCVRLLTDIDGDGRFDRQSLFADDLHYPTGIACWAGGVFVGAAPDLLYLKDTNGDGRADVRETVITGFGSDPSGEGQLNSFHWTLDNRIRISTGSDGGELRPAGRPDAIGLQARGRSVLLDPRQRAFELTSGGGQYGMSRYDWGRTFVCANSDPAQLVIYDDRYLERNPAMTAPAAVVNIAPQGKFTKFEFRSFC